MFTYSDRTANLRQLKSHLARCLLISRAAEVTLHTRVSPIRKSNHLVGEGDAKIRNAKFAF